MTDYGFSVFFLLELGMRMIAEGLHFFRMSVSSDEMLLPGTIFPQEENLEDMKQEASCSDRMCFLQNQLHF